MFSRIGYIVRETLANLTRNLTLTIASLLTVVVSLSFVGFAFLIQDAVSNQLFEWKDGVEVSIFMNPDASPDQIDGVRRALEPAQNTLIKSSRYVDATEALVEIKKLFPNTPELTALFSKDGQGVPTSFRVKPTSTESAVISSITSTFRSMGGVSTVRSADQAIAFIRKISSFARWGLGVGAVSLLAAAVLLIWNTIRTAMFARRREIEVMKLVGATNWFIRWPFIIEGMVQGLLGAATACGLVWTGKNLWRSKVLGSFGSQLSFERLQATEGQFRSVIILLLVIGAVAGSVASAIASSRFLDV
jgi:cell division transport system permease protein